MLGGRGPARIENLVSFAQVRAGGGAARILGINRLPGSNEDCGVPGLAPTGASWLSGHLQVGRRVVLDEQLRRLNGGAFSLTPRTSIVSAAPILLREGRIAIDASREGVFDPRDLDNYSFSADRHGRTFAGVHRRGRLILVTAAGIPGESEGLTLTEEAELMQSLGATDAMNLDGGGSTSFRRQWADGQRPVRRDGARPVGDSVVIVP